MIVGGHVVVTGAFGALGRAVVTGLAGRGAEVIAIDVAERAPALPAELVLESVDLNDEASLVAAMAKIREVTGALAGLINIAGGFAWETVGEGSLETWDRLYRLNLRSALAMSQAALPLLRKGGGAIVNVGAASAAQAGAGLGAYAASKAGVARLTEAMAAELKDEGVRVNAVLPSIIDTPANRAEMPHAVFSRWVSPEQLEKVVAFLLSNDASAITGALIPVTGRV
jgi:NAD(P)-dependent dehydrogenase (short-subunit alcohol dehydrogenase family)